MVAANVALRPEKISDAPFRNFSFERALREVGEVRDWLESEDALNSPLHEVEEQQEKRMREVNRLFLKAHIEARGIGDVGPAVEVRDTEDPKIARIHTHLREHERHVTTIFGGIPVNRRAYLRKASESIHPLDEELELPERSLSYTVQRRLSKAVLQGPFDEALERIEETTGATISKRTAEDVAREVSADFDAFYETRRAPKPSRRARILVGCVDGKGIPLIKRELPPPREGEKPYKKKMSTVATTYYQRPRIRTPQEVVESLFREREDENRPKLPGPEGKRVWASVKNSKEDVIAEMAAEMSRRDPWRRLTWVVVCDGEKALRTRLKMLLPGGVILVLDLLHVLQHLWDAANELHGKGTEAAREWVRERALRILRGEVSQVVKGMRQTVTKRGLTGKAKKVVLGAASYFYENRARMKYHVYLRKGLPIASGAVEGACKNLVKDRMERSGMRWCLDGAEAVVKLRAIERSGDWDAYWLFHIRCDQQRIHPAGRWNVVVEE
jgi:hypothetical protein